MRRTFVLLFALLVAWTVAPVAAVHAQAGGGDDSDQKKKERNAEWNLRQAPLPGVRNAGPCPFVKVLYDAARYMEFKDNKEASADVRYTGEIEGVSSTCEYTGADPIKVKMLVLFSFGRGPQADSAHKTYRYWVAVTQRNRQVITKDYFDLPVSFPTGQDRTSKTDTVKEIVIPRAAATVSGENFEILVGFDVTPEMADFNRQGKRFRVNAGAPAKVASSDGK
jgi:hypothetical protein